MPGPMSAPNGNVSLTDRNRNGKMVVTGKTAQKRTGSQSQKKRDEIKRFQQSRAAQRAQEED